MSAIDSPFAKGNSDVRAHVPGFEETIYRIHAICRGDVFPSSFPVDDFHVRDCFLDWLTDIYGFIRTVDQPDEGDARSNALNVLRGARRKQVAQLCGLYHAAFEVDWELAAPWILEDVVCIARDIWDAQEAQHMIDEALARLPGGPG